MESQRKPEEDKEKTSIILTYDTSLNMNGEEEGSKTWYTLILPFTDQCCLKVLDMTIKYREGTVIDNMSGFFSIKNSNRFLSKLNQKGRFERVFDYYIKRTMDIIHCPLSMPGTEKPKVTVPVGLDIRKNETEIKFSISDHMGEAIVIQRGVFVFEIVRYVNNPTL